MALSYTHCFCSVQVFFFLFGSVLWTAQFSINLEMIFTKITNPIWNTFCFSRLICKFKRVCCTYCCWYFLFLNLELNFSFSIWWNVSEAPHCMITTESLKSRHTNSAKSSSVKTGHVNACRTRIVFSCTQSCGVWWIGVKLVQRYVFRWCPSSSTWLRFVSFENWNWFQVCFGLFQRNVVWLDELQSYGLRGVFRLFPLIDKWKIEYSGEMIRSTNNY